MRPWASGRALWEVGSGKGIRRSIAGAMLSVINTEKIEAVVAEQPQALRQSRKLIYINKEIEDAVAEFVAHGCHPPMYDVTFVKT